MSYHWCMKDKLNGAEVLGASPRQVAEMEKDRDHGDLANDMIDERAIPSVKDLERAIQRDCQSAIALLNAILTDADMRNHMAVFVKGRLENANNKRKE